MQLKDVMHNAKEAVKMHFVKYAYIYAPVLGLIIYGALGKVLEPNIDESFRSNLINISGILAGFLFTSLGIIMTLPENKFTQLLSQIGYLKIIYNSMIIGIITLLISMLLGLFSPGDQVAIILFIIGISETFISAYYIYKVSYYSGKSK